MFLRLVVDGIRGSVGDVLLERSRRVVVGDVLLGVDNSDRRKRAAGVLLLERTVVDRALDSVVCAAGVNIASAGDGLRDRADGRVVEVVEDRSPVGGVELDDAHLSSPRGPRERYPSQNIISSRQSPQIACVGSSGLA